MDINYRYYRLVRSQGDSKLDDATVSIALVSERAFPDETIPDGRSLTREIFHVASARRSKRNAIYKPRYDRERVFRENACD